MKTQDIPVNEFNFCTDECKSSDIEIYFQQEKVYTMNDWWSMAHVMHFCKIFPSVSQAKKNGWNYAIPEGYNEFTVGKNKTKIFILNLKD